MGMQVGLVAVKTSASNLRAAFPSIWTKYEVVSGADLLNDYEEMLHWKRENEHFVAAVNWSFENPGKSVHVFYQDGPWAVMLESSFSLVSNESALSKLSEQFGRVVSFLVESTAGCAFFWCFEGGRLRRSIANNGEATDIHGDALAEEAGIDIDGYYMDETEQLMQAFGLSCLDKLLPSASYQAIAVIDRTDYGAARKARAAPAPTIAAEQHKVPPKKMPWWKVW